jgi:hypothetical protein
MDEGNAPFNLQGFRTPGSRPESNFSSNRNYPQELTSNKCNSKQIWWKHFFSSDNDTIKNSFYNRVKVKKKLYFIEGFLKKFFVKFKEVWKLFVDNRKKRHEKTTTAVEFWLLILSLFSDILAFYVKPESTQNYQSNGFLRSSLKSIGTIFIPKMLHWTNGYCYSLASSADDG